MADNIERAKMMIEAVVVAPTFLCKDHKGDYKRLKKGAAVTLPGDSFDQAAAAGYVAQKERVERSLKQAKEGQDKDGISAADRKKLLKQTDEEAADSAAAPPVNEAAGKPPGR